MAFIPRQSKTSSKSGSLVNWLMGNNSTIPKVNEGATICLWSDRHAYEVIWVNEDNTQCKIQRYNPKRIDKLGMSDCQTYEYKELTSETMELVWRKLKKNSGWFSVGKQVRVIPKVAKYMSEKSNKFAWKDQIEDVFGKDIADKVVSYNKDIAQYEWSVVEGVTKEYTTYHRVSIIFGRKDEHYDFSF